MAPEVITVPYAGLCNPQTGRLLSQHQVLCEVREGRLHSSLEAENVPSWVKDIAMQCLQFNEYDRPNRSILRKKERMEEKTTLLENKLQEKDEFRVREQVGAYVSLGLQVALANITRIALTTIDSAFLGHLGTEYLAAASLATIWTQVPLFSVWAMSSSLITLCGQAFGAKNYKLMGIWFQMALIAVTSLACGVFAYYWCINYILVCATDDTIIVDLGTRFARILSGAIWPILAYACMRQYLQAMGIVAPTTAIGSISISLAVIANSFFIYGAESWHGLGFDGSAVATVVASWFQPTALFLYAFVYRGYHKQAWNGWDFKAFNKDRWQTFIRMAIPLGLIDGFTTLANSCMSLIAAHMGAEILASNAILLTFWALLWALFWGFGCATQVKVANQLGAGYPNAARSFSRLGFATIILVASAVAISMLCGQDYVLRIYTNDPVLIQHCISVMPLFVCGFSLDALEITLTAILNGMGQMPFVSTVAFVGMWCVQLPVSYLLAIHFNYGFPGLWCGICITAGFKLCVLSIKYLTVDWHRMALVAMNTMTEGSADTFTLQPESVIPGSPVNAMYEAYLVDVINKNLVTIEAHENIDLLLQSMAIHKTYSTLLSSTDIHLTYVRRLALLKLTSLEFAIKNLRNIKTYRVVTDCVVQIFELAQTIEVQKQFAANGAVYFEALLRDTDIKTFNTFYVGLKWLNYTILTQNTNTITSWKSYNISYFQMQWTNDRELSIAESIYVKNALGMTLTIVLKNCLLALDLGHQAHSISNWLVIEYLHETTTQVNEDLLTHMVFMLIKPFFCKHTNLNNITIDEDTAIAINALNAWDENPNLSLGFELDNNIMTDPVKCTLIRGVIQRLFEGKTTYHVTACVLSSPTANWLLRVMKLWSKELTNEVWVGLYGAQQSRQPRQVQNFIDEIVLMSQLENDYIVKFIGASWTRPIEIQCVVEYMDLGDLHTYLINHIPQQFTWGQKYQSIVSHTYKPPIIHRDLKSRNVLLDNVKGTKLTDFGTSRIAEDDDTLTEGIGTYQWMAPEVIVGPNYLTQADNLLIWRHFVRVVYTPSLLDLHSGQLLTRHHIQIKILEGRLRPSFDGDNIPKSVKDIALQFE
ncbi:Multidrug/Oligosaccharidyl-lipid/Polysaccharide (MOP) Flippase Superfamily [Thraustotheca clavata]|uniref:Multidrug/Oligosaccharidyl-lipid/Polysaccharide (MOP) Flippase Superfamily n=1 Tax=Thraustotheca clavata TaxID=74557 RepID=A0A1V9ZFF2_9STRA|nr:Multidrug/Oligosaccharidyl-lipid/Polysaccharide (MOP) Flippase Superfamily [Thraustotheca clavata]